MLSILIDTDMLLDALTGRVWVTDDPLDIWEAIKFNQIQGYITDIGFDRIIGILGKLQSINAAELVSLAIQQHLLICETSAMDTRKALSVRNVDYESAIEIVCAEKYSLGAILTHRPQDFDCVDVMTLSIRDLLNRQSLEDFFISNIVHIFSGNNSDMYKLQSALYARYIGRLNTLPAQAMQALSLIGVDISHQNLEGMDFAFSRMTSSKLVCSILRGVNFSNAHLYEADLSYANLQNVDFQKTCLVHANLSGAKLQFSNAKHADLRYCNLKDANIDSSNWNNSQLRRANLKNATIKHSFFNDTDLSHAVLDNACLVGISLFNANCENASFKNANFQGATLKHVNFRGADLSGACLRHSNLRGADLRGAILDGADLTGAHISRTQISIPLLVAGHS